MVTWLVVCILFVSGSGCEDQVVAVTETDMPFSLFGVISPQLDTQWVRVYPVEGSLVPLRDEALDGVLTSINRNSGEERIWTDSLLVDANDQFSHVYWSPFQAEFATTYDLEITRSDGASSAVEVNVPREAELELGAVSVAPAQQEVWVTAPVPNLFKVEVSYFIEYKFALSPEIIQTVRTRSYEGTERLIEDQWRINVLLWQDFASIRNELREINLLDNNYGIILRGLAMDLIVGSADWVSPDPTFDPEILVQPGLLSNVENGFGFVGAGFRLDLDWIPPDNVIESAGFRPPEDDDRPLWTK